MQSIEHIQQKQKTLHLYVVSAKAQSQKKNIAPQKNHIPKPKIVQVKKTWAVTKLNLVWWKDSKERWLSKWLRMKWIKRIKKTKTIQWNRRKYGRYNFINMFDLILRRPYQRRKMCMQRANETATSDKMKCYEYDEVIIIILHWLVYVTLSLLFENVCWETRYACFNCLRIAIGVFDVRVYTVCLYMCFGCMVLLSPL